MDKILRTWIVNIISQNERIVQIAVRQRAKFEGWLKFELAALAEQNGAKNVIVESRSTDSTSLQRADISFNFNGIEYDIELKTPNTNWRIDGIFTKTRPITKNVKGIIHDAQKLQLSPKQGIVAFVLFPLPVNSNKWIPYLTRISEITKIVLAQERHCYQQIMMLPHEQQVALIVGSFLVPRKGSPP